MNEKEVEVLLRKTKAILEGHFLLTSGLHSPLYVEKFNVLQHPEYTEQLCREFAEHFKDKGIQTVIGPATGGIILSQVTGRLLGVRSIFTERENGKMTLRRGFQVKRFSLLKISLLLAVPLRKSLMWSTRRMAIS